ncbi:unnamed protein product, partial [Polarella glacialis]
EVPFSNLSYYATDPRGGAALANSWRVTSDVIEARTYRFAYRVGSELATWAGAGAYNDPDMLLGSSPGAARTLSPAQSRTQFNLWAILMAPLLLGADLTALTGFDLHTYSNEEVLAVSQDPLC